MGGNVNLLSVIIFLFPILTTCASEEGFVISFTENDIVSTEQWAIFTGNTKTNLGLHYSLQERYLTCGT